MNHSSTQAHIAANALPDRATLEAFTKILVSIARADALVRPVELAFAARILTERFHIDSEPACEEVLAALGRLESEHTLGACLSQLRDRGGSELLAGLVEDIREIAIADAELHENEVILLDGLAGMVRHLQTAA